MQLFIFKLVQNKSDWFLSMVFKYIWKFQKTDFEYLTALLKWKKEVDMFRDMQLIRIL